LGGVDLSVWMAEHRITETVLADGEQRLPWASFAGLLGLLEKILGGPLALEQFGAELAAAHPLFRQLAALHFGLAEIQQIAAEMLVPELFAGVVQPLVSAQPGGAMRITLALEREHQSAYAFWAFVSGLWRPLPRLFELGDSLVEVEMADRFAEFLVIFPTEGSVEPSVGQQIRQRVRESLLNDLVRYERLVTLPSPDTRTSVFQRRINSVTAQERAAKGLAELEQDIRRKLQIERMQLFETTDVGLRRRGSVGIALDGPRIRRMLWVSGVAIGAIEIERQGEAGHAREASLLDEHIEEFALRFAELQNCLPIGVSPGGFAPAEAELRGPASASKEVPPSSRGRVARAAREGRLREFTEAWQLSERQRSVLALLVDGLGNREIAARLGCTTGTIENHVTKLLKRANVESRSALTAAFWSGQRY
jgi:DNA-binding CsgD family transcriptional regulator